MKRLAVVGAGAAGRWLTRIARAQGIDTTLYDDPERPSATPAALALLRPTHLTHLDRPQLAPSLAAWADAGAQLLSGADYTTWNRPDTRHQPDWTAIDPLSAEIAAPDRLTRRSDIDLDAEITVWCVGPYAPTGGDQITYGATWVHPTPEALTDSPAPLRVHQLAPYKVLAAARFASGARLGSSSARTPTLATQQAHALFAHALRLGWITDTEGWRLVTGSRLLRAHRLTRHSPRSWSWAGFHRTGFGVIPAEAATVLRTIQE